MAKITFSQSNQAGDIPTYEFTKEQIRNSNFPLLDQLRLCDDKVFVCFPTIKSYDLNPSEEHEREHPEFLITNEYQKALNYFNYYQLDFVDLIDFHFNFFCFENYEEAFKYCIDLKEGL